MDISVQNNSEKPIKAAELPNWMLSHGVKMLDTKEISALIGIPENQVRQRLAAHRRSGRIVSPARGLWMAVPPERLEWGAPEPATYIDELMRRKGCDYYVGWLSAASVYGSSHQAPQEFQVASAKRIRPLSLGRSNIRFFERPVADIPTKRIPNSGGLVTLSTPGATMLDIMRDLGMAAGLDNAATVVLELAEECDGFESEAVAAARTHSATTVRRLGWVLERLGGHSRLEDLKKISDEKQRGISLLYPYAKRSGNVDARWMLDTNREVKPDL